ncbi:MAG: hypothetical protein PW845_21450 [Pseudomonas sp.]|nr:hypothetical protein [Pseudomonas sp.]
MLNGIATAVAALALPDSERARAIEPLNDTAPRQPACQWATQVDEKLAVLADAPGRQRISVEQYIHLITDRPDPTDSTTWDWSPAFQAAVDAHRFVLAPPQRVTFRSSVNLPSNTVLWGHGCEIAFDNTSSFYVFKALAPYNANSYFTEFLRNIHISGFTFAGSHIQDGDGWTDVMALLAVNVRGLRFESNRMLRCGGLWVRHAIEAAQRYEAASEYTHEAFKNDSFWANGGNPDEADDLNEDIHFLNNHVDVQGYYRQACRVHFARRIVVADNTVDFGALSFWGGNPSAVKDESVPRRIIDLNVVGNHVQRNQACIYAMMAMNFVIANNTCRYSLDVCIDVEGALNGTVIGNVAQDAGNFVFGEYWYGKNIQFTGNIGIQTGAGRDLAESRVFGSAYAIKRFAHRQGNRVWSDSGVDRISNVNGREMITIQGNGFYSTAPFPVYCALNTYSWMSVKNNTFFDVLLHTRFTAGAAGIPEVVGNTFFVSHDLRGGAALQVEACVLKKAFVRDNRVVVMGINVQSAGACGILLKGSAYGQSLEFICEGNEVHILDNPGGELRAAIAYDIESSATTRRHRVLFKNNICREIVDLTASAGHTLVMMEGNRDAEFLAIPRGDPPTSGGWLQGTRIPAADLSDCAYEGVLAERSGFALGDHEQRQLGQAYRLDQVVWAEIDGVHRVLRCTVAGVAGELPVTLKGLLAVDGNMKWVCVGDRIKWRQYGALL